jgi:type II secretory pathway predicted ATPase ExeA
LPRQPIKTIALARLLPPHEELAMPTPTSNAALTLRQLADQPQRVFPTYPQVDRYFPAAAIEAARQRLGRAIQRGDGPAVLIGGPGTGKSLLLQVLAAQYHERFDVVLLACARLCTRRALLQAILFELGLPYKSRDEGELRLSLLDQLLSTVQCPAGLLLLVDEAQTLPIALLDELRVLTNLVRGGAPRVRLVLAGSATLEESFASAELESFSQRLSARCYLPPLCREETTQFIRASIAAAGAAPEELFGEDAYRAVFEASDGVPRLVNQLCDRAIDFALSHGQARVNAQAVQTAWSDLQQLPTPWETPDAPEFATDIASPVVEFGDLSENTVDGEPAVVDTAFNAHAVAEIEPTELDDEDDWAEPEVSGTSTVSAARQHQDESGDRSLSSTARQMSQADQREAGNPASNHRPAGPIAAQPSITPSAADPFAEEFDEEEVVLDNFAAWDDTFRQLLPCVENRRDPGFSQRVQAAIEVSTETVPGTCSTNVAGEHEELSEESFLTPSEVDDPSSPETDEAWPPLRLAIVSEPAPLQPIPLVPPGRKKMTRAVSHSCGSRPPEHLHETVPDTFFGAEEEPPILLVEEEPSPQPPVRRENYRNLFSRLRSG